MVAYVPLIDVNRVPSLITDSKLLTIGTVTTLAPYGATGMMGNPIGSTYQSRSTTHVPFEPFPRPLPKWVKPETALQKLKTAMLPPQFQQSALGQLRPVTSPQVFYAYVTER